MRPSDIPASTGTSSPVAAAVVAGSKPTMVGVPLDGRHWVPDDDVTRCSAPECRQPFTLFNRKHHCRTCAHIFCANCSSRMIPGEDGTQFRVCLQCYHRHQLVLPIMRANGQPRRRCLGQLKLLTRRDIVLILCFLDLASVAKMALVSSSMYLAARDNTLWEVQFAARFISSHFVLVAAPPSTAPRTFSESPAPPSTKQSSVASNHTAATHHRTLSLTGVAADAASPSQAVAPPAPPVPSQTSAVGGNASFYNYSMFSVFVKHLAADRCEGLATYAARARQLLTVGPRFTVIGTTGAGKTMLIRKFAGDVNSIASAGTSTVGMRAYEKRVSVTGSVSTTTSIVLYEISGEARFDSLRVMCAKYSHGVVVCYDPEQRDGFECARQQLATVEARLSPVKPVVVVCGVIRKGYGDAFVPALHSGERVTVKEAEGMSPNCVASLHVTLSQSSMVIEAALQGVINRLYDRAAPLLAHPTPLDVVLNQA